MSSFRKISREESLSVYIFIGPRGGGAFTCHHPRAEEDAEETEVPNGHVPTLGKAEAEMLKTYGVVAVTRDGKQHPDWLPD